MCEQLRKALFHVLQLRFKSEARRPELCLDDAFTTI
jgi:hypothetical protein